MPKGTCPAEAMLNGEKIKPIAFPLILLSYACLKAVSQSAENSVKLLFFSNLLKALRVNLKACLGIVLPNQYCLIVVRGWFLGDFFMGHA